MFLFGGGAAVERATRPVPASCATAKVSAQTTSATAAALQGAAQETEPSRIQKVLAFFGKLWAPPRRGSHTPAGTCSHAGTKELDLESAFISEGETMF